jgi:hypothetical protein
MMAHKFTTRIYRVMKKVFVHVMITIQKVTSNV